MTTKQSKKTILSNKVLVTLLLATALLAIVQLAFNVYVWKYVVNRDDGRMASLVIDAIDNLGSPVPVDAQTGKRYIAEERLVLPAATPDAQRLTYIYDAVSEGHPAELTLTTPALTATPRNVIRNVAATKVSANEGANRVFELVPTLQACSRGVHVVFGELDTEGLNHEGSKTLADGRTVNFYSESECSGDMAPLVGYLKQVESY